MHKESLLVAIASYERGGEVRFYGNNPNQLQSITHLFLEIKKQYSSVIACYETGPCGYNIYHQLTAMNIECIAVALSRIQKSPTDRIKNDHRDTVGLARLFRAGELTPVWIPDLTH
ncbi:TPA: transposase [Citrobacter werkmanii]|nr:transposase [Citrobacter werkmanii]